MLAVEQRPDKAGFSRGDNSPDLRMPAFEGRERAVGRGAVRPILAVPAVMLGPADKIEEPPARDEVVHEMRAWPDPGLRAKLEAEIGDALHGHQPAIGDTAGKAQRLLTEQGRAHRRVDAVSADQHIGSDARPILEPRRDAVASIGEANEAVAEMDGLGREARGDGRQQIGAVDRDVRRAVKLLTERIEPRPLQSPAVLPAPLMRADRAHRLAVEPGAEPQPIENARRIRPHIDAAADFGQFLRLLIDLDREAPLVQRHGRAEPANAGADHGDFKRGHGHLCRRCRVALAPRSSWSSCADVLHGCPVRDFSIMRTGSNSMARAPRTVMAGLVQLLPDQGASGHHQQQEGSYSYYTQRAQPCSVTPTEEWYSTNQCSCP